MKYLQFFLLLIILLTNDEVKAQTTPQYALCIEGVMAVRKEPNQQSEQVTQLLFGDLCKIMEQPTGSAWVYIENYADTYKGWILKNALYEVETQYAEAYIAQPQAICAEKKVVLQWRNKNIPLYIGSTLPFLENDSLRIGYEKIAYKGKSILISEKQTSEQMLNTAYQYLETPYLWGGKSPEGIDCSGFTQMVFKISGYSLLRDSYQQAEQGELVLFEDIRAGDLVFFQKIPLSQGTERVRHVGIALGNGKIIHADGKVRINTLNATGLYREDWGAYSHYLKWIRRIK